MLRWELVFDADILHTLEVQLLLTSADRSYPIVIGRALLGDGTFWHSLIAGRGVILRQTIRSVPCMLPS